jgi:hypothetical protein
VDDVEVQSLQVSVNAPVRGVSVANCNSGGNWCLKEAIAVLSPPIRVEVCELGLWCTAPLSRRESRQSSVTAMLVVIRPVGLQLALEISLAPEQCPIEELAPNGSYQSLNESV